jgi:hypothetical protein
MRCLGIAVGFGCRVVLLREESWMQRDLEPIRFRFFHLIERYIGWGECVMIWSGCQEGSGRIPICYCFFFIDDVVGFYPRRNTPPNLGRFCFYLHNQSLQVWENGDQSSIQRIKHVQKFAVTLSNSPLDCANLTKGLATFCENIGIASLVIRVINFW